VLLLSRLCCSFVGAGLLAKAIFQPPEKLDQTRRRDFSFLRRLRFYGRHIPFKGLPQSAFMMLGCK